MSVESELVTREELDAILNEVADGASSASDAALAQPFRRDRSSGRAERSDAASELRRAVGRFAESWGNQLANRYQRRVRCSVIGWEELDTQLFAESLLATDRPTLIEGAPHTGAGFVSFSRPLLFALLALSFGGRRGTGTPVPEREYTKIELRFLRHLAAQVLSELGRAWSDPSAHELRLAETVAPAEFVEQAAPTVLLASLDVTGQDLEGRVRVALPRSWARSAETDGVAPRPAREPALERAVGGLPLRVCAEVGYAELGLRRLGALEPGDVIELQRSVPDGLLVRVAGRPKFLAVRGSVGRRLAVQVVERIQGGGAAS